MIDHQELTDRLLKYLETAPESPEYLSNLPENLSTFDPYQMVSEWIVLRQEIKQQNKLFQSANTGLQQSLDIERARNEQLQTQITTPAKNREDSSPKELLAVMDDLDRVIAHNQTQIAAILATPAPKLSWWQKLIYQQPHPILAQTTATYLEALTSNQQGIEIIRRSLLAILRQRQITPIIAIGEPFDSQCMYAIAQQPSDIVPANCVIQEVVRGYRQGDRILREAQVIVAGKS